LSNAPTPALRMMLAAIAAAVEQLPNTIRG
jgi:hypothetical protein